MRFMIRDLLRLMIVGALAAAWWADRASLKKEVESLGKTAWGNYWVDDRTALDEFIKQLNQQAKLPNPSAPLPKSRKD